MSIHVVRGAEDDRAAAADRVALFLAEMQTGRLLAGGVTHDLNSALQVLGDALFAIRGEAQSLRQTDGAPSQAAEGISRSLTYAEGAFDRLAAIARVVPGIVPELVDEAGPINIEAELRAIVALTRHHWKHRLSIVVDPPGPTPAFWGRWWVARLAAMRMIMLASDGHRRTAVSHDSAQLPTARLTGRLTGARVELRMSLENRGSAPNTATPDSVLLLCAKCLGGEIVTTTPPSGGALTSFHFPVRLALAEGCL